MMPRDFSGGPVFKTLYFQSRDAASRSHMSQGTEKMKEREKGRKEERNHG